MLYSPKNNPMQSLASSQPKRLDEIAHIVFTNLSKLWSIARPDLMDLSAMARPSASLALGFQSKKHLCEEAEDKDRVE